MGTVSKMIPPPDGGEVRPRTELYRKLTAILYADIAGFSRMTGENEDRTFHLLQSSRDLAAAGIRAHNGHIVNSVGDAVLADFRTVIEALNCACAIQRELAERNRSLPEEQQIKFRMSVNLGDVIVDAEQAIYGNGVNVAARLAALAEPGGICISESVYTAVGNKLPLHYRFIGEKRVKNITEPVRAYHVGLDAPPLWRGRYWRKLSQPRFAGPVFALVLIAGLAAAGYKLVDMDDRANKVPDSMAKRSLTVLPFTNSSNDKNQEYLADGFTDDLITDLAKISGIFVIARDSAFTYKNSSLNSRQIARELNVRFVLEGSVRRAGEQIRVNAQLTNAASGTILWAERYDGKIESIFDLQDKITERIVSALAVTLSMGERETVTRQDTNDPEAYEIFLKGQERYHRHSRSEMLAARQQYQEALKLDPNFARAYAMLAMTYWFEFANGWTVDPEQSLAHAQRLADKAVSLDDAMPVAHFVLGLVHRERREYARALVEAEKAIAIDPNYANGRVLLASVLYYAGRAKEGLQRMQEAIQLHPYHPHNYPFHLGQAYFILRNYDRAIEIFKEGLDSNPTSQRLRLWLAAAYANAGRVSDAEWELELLRTNDPELTIKRIEHAYPFKYHAELENFLDALRKAGLT